MSRKWVINYGPKIAVVGIAGALALAPVSAYADSEDVTPEETKDEVVQEIILEDADPETPVIPEVTEPTEAEPQESLEEDIPEPVDENLPEDELSDAPENQEVVSVPEEPAEEPEEIIADVDEEGSNEDYAWEGEELFEDEEEEETPIYETVRLFVAGKFRKNGDRINVSKFNLPASDEEELAGCLSMSFDDFTIYCENGKIVEVVIAEEGWEDDPEDDEAEASYFRDSYAPPAPVEETVVLAETEEADEEEVVTEEVETVEVIQPAIETEEQSAEEPIGFFMAFLLVLVTIVKNAVTLL